MGFAQSHSSGALARTLISCLSKADFRVLHNAGYLRAPDRSIYLPDVAIVPGILMQRFRTDPMLFEIYDESLPFVAEVWSPPNGLFDVDTKFPAYRLRGDAEIWRIHPFERTVTIWLKHPNGTYEETIVRSRPVNLQALPSVAIVIDDLFMAT
jgi:hypothetical protein